jgi:hypothetical protein
VLAGYDGDPSRYAEIEEDMNIVPLAARDAAEADWLRAKRALEHLRDTCGDITEHGYSLRYWANNALLAFGDDEAQQRMEDEYPLSKDLYERVAEAHARFDEGFARRTAEVLVIVDPLDEECASHLSVWTDFGDGHGRTATALHPLSGPVAEADEDVHVFASPDLGLPTGTKQHSPAF